MSDRKQSSNIAGVGLMLLGIAVAIAALLGPLVLDLIRFRTSANVEQQFAGSEAVSLFVMAPFMVISGALWRREHPAASGMALAATFFVIYTYGSAVLAQEYSRYPGNVERAFPLYAALVAASVVLASSAWRDLSNHPLHPPPARLRNAMATVMIGTGVLIALAWSGQIALVLRNDPPLEYREAPTAFWVIKLFDLGFVVPAVVTTGIEILRNQPGALRFACGLGGFLTSMAAAVTAMVIAMTLQDDPSAQPILIAILGPLTISLALLTLALMRAVILGLPGFPWQPSRDLGDVSLVETPVDRRTRCS